jgi:hypothetical protein
LAIEFDQFVILLQIFIGLAGEDLNEERGTSTMERCPVAWVLFCISLSSAVVISQ